MHSTLYRVLVVGALLAAANMAAANSLPQVHFVLSSEAAPYTELVSAASGALDGVAEITVGGIGESDAGAVLVVTVGVAAARDRMPAEGGRPVISTLIPQASWEALRDDSAHPRTAIFLDQPFRRQVALVHAILPPARDLGVVLGPASIDMYAELLDEATESTLRIQAVRVSDSQHVASAVADVLRRSDTLLALPDPVVFNRFTVQSVLLTGYRMRRPVLGFSEAWVRAGALAAVFSTPRQTGLELGTMVIAWLEDRTALPPPAKPETYTLSVNRQVAHSLGIALPTDELLLRRLRDLEAEE